MSDDRKKPLWPWIVALLVGLPVLYVASFGPACWWFSKTATFDPALSDVDEVIDRPRDLYPRAPRAYWPLGWLAAHAPQPISRLLFWYATAGGQQLVALPEDQQGSFCVYPP